MLDWEYALCGASETTDNALKVHPLLDGSDGTQGSPALDSMQPLGILARPFDPATDSNGVPNDGAGVLYAWHGGEGFAIPTTDPRILKKIPPLAKGGTALHSSNPSSVGFVLLKGEDGGLLILIPGKNANQSHAISIDPGGDSIQIRHAQGMGMAITGGAKNSTVINNKSGNAYVEVNDDGVTVNGNLTLNGGLALGQLASAKPVALAPPLQAYVTALQTAMTAVGNAANGIVPGCYMPAVDTALQALAAQVTGAAGASTKLSASP